MADFTDSVTVVLKHEGGYVMDPADPGGETKYGISKKTFPNVDIPNLTKLEAMEIYRKYYWNPNNISSVENQQVANAVLDAVVHHGRGAEIVQKALRRCGLEITVDNVIGTETVSALNTVSPKNFLSAYVKERKKYMETLIARDPKLAKYREGWFKRVNFFLPGGIRGTGIVIVAIATGLAIWLFGRKR